MTTDDSAAGHDRRNLAGLGSLVFASGFAGLVLQVAWFREFALVFGGSTAASAAVLAIFMGGLGAGSALWGARVDRQADPLRIYAHLVLLVGLTGALSGYLIDASRVLYISLGGQSTLGLGIATLTRLVLAAAVLAVPTVLNALTVLKRIYDLGFTQATSRTSVCLDNRMDRPPGRYGTGSKYVPLTVEVERLETYEGRMQCTSRARVLRRWIQQQTAVARCEEICRSSDPASRWSNS